MPGLGERLLQLEVVLDDAVVHHRHAAVAVRVGVLVGRLAVRGPAGMADAGRAARRLLAEALLQIGELALGAHDREALLPQDREARRIIAAVLELAQTLDEQVRAILVADVPNDAAH